jgi:hypothetical protein
VRDQGGSLAILISNYNRLMAMTDNVRQRIDI